MIENGCMDHFRGNPALGYAAEERANLICQRTLYYKV
jgi:hypothetical protein